MRPSRLFCFHNRGSFQLVGCVCLWNTKWVYTVLEFETNRRRALKVSRRRCLEGSVWSRFCTASFHSAQIEKRGHGHVQHLLSSERVGSLCSLSGLSKPLGWHVVTVIPLSTPRCRASNGSQQFQKCSAFSRCFVTIGLLLISESMIAYEPLGESKKKGSVIVDGRTFQMLAGLVHTF